MPVPQRFPAFVLFLLSLIVLSGCEDDPTPPDPRDPRILLIPIDLSLPQAAAQAMPGDTLQFVSSVTVGTTVVFREDQTPLLLKGLRNQTWIFGSMGDRPILSFDSPRDGTRIVDMGLSGGEVAVEVDGSGILRVQDCTFEGGVTHVRGMGSVTLDVTENLMRNAALFSLDVAGSATLSARNNTIDNAGDCGIRFQESGAGLVKQCIIWRSQNFGIACLGTEGLADSSGCNDIHLSANGPYGGCTAPPTDFDLNPRFCDPDAGDYTLQPISPCAPLHSGGCDLIGAFPPVDCDTT